MQRDQGFVRLAHSTQTLGRRVFDRHEYGAVRLQLERLEKLGLLGPEFIAIARPSDSGGSGAVPGAPLSLEELERLHIHAKALVAPVHAQLAARAVGEVQGAVDLVVDVAREHAVPDNAAHRFGRPDDEVHQVDRVAGVVVQRAAAARARAAQDRSTKRREAATWPVAADPQ